MAETTMEMTPEQLARAMSNRVVRERRRIAQRLDEFAAEVQGWTLDELLANAGPRLNALAEEVRSGVQVIEPPVIAPAPAARPLADNDPGDGLPPIREMDDFAEGVSLIRSRTVGVTGRLRD